MCKLMISSKNVFPPIDTFLFLTYFLTGEKQSLITCIHGRDPEKLNNTSKWLKLSP